MERGCGRYTVRVWSVLLCNYSLLCLSVAFQMRTVQITNSPPHRAFPPAVFYPYCSQCPMPYSLACGSTNRHRLFLHVIKAHVQFRSQKKGQVLEGRALVGDKTWLCSPLLAWSSLCSLDWPRTLDVPTAEAQLLGLLWFPTVPAYSLSVLLSHEKEFRFSVNSVFPKLLASFLILELTFVFSEMADGSSETERHFASVQALCCWRHSLCTSLCPSSGRPVPKPLCAHHGMGLGIQTPLLHFPVQLKFVWTCLTGRVYNVHVWLCPHRPQYCPRCLDIVLY